MAPDVGLREYRQACNPRAPVAMYPADELAAACAAKGWTGGDCTAEGRYYTADFPGVLRHRIQQRLRGCSPIQCPSPSSIMHEAFRA